MSDSFGIPGPLNKRIMNINNFPLKYSIAYIQMIHLAHNS